jgi:hypothetical protein
VWCYYCPYFILYHDTAKTPPTAKTVNSPSLKIPETTFPEPLLYPLKQWATSPSFSTRQKPENLDLPEKSVPSQKTPKKRRKTHVNHAKKAWMEEAEE